jgi:hypothetical protein
VGKAHPKSERKENDPFYDQSTSELKLQLTEVYKILYGHLEPLQRSYYVQLRDKLKDEIERRIQN